MPPMTVTVNHPVNCSSPKIPTNKVEDLKIDMGRIAYTLDHNIVVLRPVIDRIILRYNPPKKAGEKLLKALEKLNSDMPDYKVHNDGYDAFHTNVMYSPPSGKSGILIRINPKKKNSFLWLDFSPHLIGFDGLQEFRNQLNILSDGAINFTDIAKKGGAIKEMHIAVDMLGVDVDDLIVSDMSATKGEVIEGKSHVIKSHTGRKETTYLGFKTKKHEGSHNYFYNKKKSMLEKEGISEFGNVLHSRYERRIKKMKKNSNLFDLSGMYNPFKKVGVEAVNYETAKSADYSFVLFARYAIDRNLDKALELIPDDLKDTYEANFKKSKMNIWDAQKLWSYWPDALKKSGLILPE